MRSLLIALLVLLWLILGWLYYKDYNKCCGTKSVVPAAAPVMEKTGPILFKWGDCMPVLGDGWPRMRDSLAALAVENTVFEISGWYCQNGSPSEADTMGMCRARQIRKLFPEIPDDRILLSSKGMDCDSSSRTGKFESAAFAIRKQTENIKETADGTDIYFPFNSTRKLNNAEVEGYLNDVAERVKKSGEKVVLTGHTDAIGSDESNIRLGQSRADIVRDYLLSKGVPAAQIQATSKGESDPIGDNNTEAGRAKNRRTHLQIIK